MWIIYFLLFTTTWASLGVCKSVANSDEDTYEALVDVKVEYDDENEEIAAERPNRKQMISGMRNFVGTNLFDGSCRKKCFSMEDVALLAARRDFESLVPKNFPYCLLDDDLTKLLMQYFYGADQVIEKMASGQSKLVSQKAFYDTMGGYLKYYMVPISKYSYYAGLLKLKTVENILQLLSQCKETLNTFGNGWRAPLTDFSDLDIQIEPLRIVVDNDEGELSCTKLDLLDEHSAEDDDMIVALPRLDTEEKGVLSNIWLPFQRKRTFNLLSGKSAFILVRYFELTTKCYRFQGICQDTFNKKFRNWILENLEVHLGDDVLYPGLGAVLRIVETLQRKTREPLVVPRKTLPSFPSQLHKEIGHLKSLHDATDDHPDNDLGGIFKPSYTYKPQNLFSVFTGDGTHTSCKRKRIYKWIGYCIAGLLLLLLLILIAYCLYKRCKRSPADKKPPKGSGTTVWFSRKSRKDDKEKLLGSKGSKKSPASSKPKKKSKPSSSPETSTCCGSCTKKSNPETTSIDSDSGKDRKKKKQMRRGSKSPANAKDKTTKAITINEKPPKSPKKPEKPKPKDGKDGGTPAKTGILRKTTFR